jgi:nicotinate-nucleotide adenylyltransferase
MSAPPAVGVLGGRFDPIHLGHLRVAESVRRDLAPSRVLLMPCAIAPHKRGAHLTQGADRLAMVRLAVAEKEGLEASSFEIDRGGISYTIDTLRGLRRALPGQAPVFILGMDALLEIETWHDHRSLLAEFDLVVVDRPGHDLRSLPASLPSEVAARIVPAGSALLGAGGRIHLLAVEPLAISSSEIRARAAASASLDGLVPPEVARYIQRRGLYRQEAAT